MATTLSFLQSSDQVSYSQHAFISDTFAGWVQAARARVGQSDSAFGQMQHLLQHSLLEPMVNCCTSSGDTIEITQCFAWRRLHVSNAWHEDGCVFRWQVCCRNAQNSSCSASAGGFVFPRVLWLQQGARNHSFFAIIFSRIFSPGQLQILFTGM